MPPCRLPSEFHPPCQLAGNSVSIRLEKDFAFFRLRSAFLQHMVAVVMPDIQAFRAIRYDLGHVGSLRDVVAPPYDVIGTEEQTRLYERHPANVVRLILNRAEPGDDAQSNMYSRASKFFKDWQRQGVLFTEGEPAIYVYHQQFDYNGASYTRRGFMARVRLERFGEGTIFPHEETMSGPKEDRFKLMTACKANLSPVFGLYPDPQRHAQNILEMAIAGQPSLEATDDLGVLHRMWVVSDPKVIAEVTAALGGKPVFIADGHHRFETACNYRDSLAKHGPLDAAHPANFVLMMCVGMSDEGMVVFPTHRLFRGLPAMTADELAAKLGDCFRCRAAGDGPEAASSVWEDMETYGSQGLLGFYTQSDHRWTLAELTPQGEKKMAELAADRSEDWRGLGVAILHRLVVEGLLGAKDLPKPGYVHLVDEAISGLQEEDFPLAALVMPPSLDQIQAVSEHLERMPAKSTYFYPKLLSGLVFHSLD